MSDKDESVDHTIGHREHAIQSLARIEANLRVAEANHGQIRARLSQELDQSHAEVTALVKELRSRPDQWTEEDLSHLRMLLKRRDDLANMLASET